MSKKKPEKPQEIVSKLESKDIQRRHVRYRLYLIKRDQDETNDGLKEYMESQFKAGQTWSTFTFNWDVAVNDPLKVISMEEWVRCGGKFDEMGRRIPSAFTNQD